MFVFTTKVTFKKLVVGAMAVCAIVVGVAMLATEPVTSVSMASGEVEQKLKDNDSRILYLKSFGLDPKEMPIVYMEVQIPKEFDENYMAYNEIQKNQGLDLTEYQGKQAMLYSYELETHESGETGVTANLVLYKDKVIAADVCSSNVDGFLIGITEEYNAE